MAAILSGPQYVSKAVSTTDLVRKHGWVSQSHLASHTNAVPVAIILYIINVFVFGHIYKTESKLQFSLA